MRRKIDSDTDVFTYVNPNPKKANTTDCVVRAISLALEKPYVEVCNGLFNIYLKYGYHLCDRHCYERYLKQQGWVKQHQPKKADNTKYTASEFCKIRQKCGSLGNLIIHLGCHHVAAIVNNKVNDSWDSTDGCVGIIYTKI